MEVGNLTGRISRARGVEGAILETQAPQPKIKRRRLGGGSSRMQGILSTGVCSRILRTTPIAYQA